MKSEDVRFFGGIGCCVFFVLAMIGGGMAGCPAYNVYLSHKMGEGEFARAEANRKILTQTAEAKRDSAIFEAQAEIERAKGIAEANRIIGDSLNNNEAYLRYLWIDSLRHGGNDTIYVPTEANLPILEAGRLGTPKHLSRKPEVGDVEKELTGDHVHQGTQDSKAVKE